MEISNDWTVLAHLLRPQGRKGEILADSLTDFPTELKDRQRLFLAKPGFSGAAGDARPVEVTSFWLPKGKNEGRIVLEIAGCNSIEEAERLAGLEVITPQEDRLPLSEDESYISDLVGCTVFDRGQLVGTVEDVQFATSPDGRRRLSDAAPLLEVLSPAGDDLLLPFVKVFLISVDLHGRRIEMELPEGLLELNRSTGPMQGDSEA